MKDQKSKNEDNKGLAERGTIMPILITILLVSGILLAGSDSVYFPAPNILGIILFGGAGMQAEKKL